MKPAPAAYNTDAIASIRVEGNQRIEPATILSYLTLKTGSNFSENEANNSLKALFATGLFADATFRREGNVLVVSVTENPIINRIAFEGNEKIKAEDLQTEIQLKPRTVLTRNKVESDVDRILTLYRRVGRFAATVEPKVIKQDQNRVDLVFEIKEGKTTEIKRLAFVGNQAFTSSKLREEVLTRETAWYNILSSDDVYDPDRIEADKEQLRHFYNENGYADFEVVSVASELTPDKEGFFITYTISEGNRYKIGKVEFDDRLGAIDPKILKDTVKTKSGEWYDSRKVEQSLNALTDVADQTRFPFVDVDAKVRNDKEKSLIDLNYVIKDGTHQYVERIDIKGNSRTEDTVIRREFKLAEGDALNKQRLKKSEQNVKDLDYFGKVNVKTDQGSAPDRKVVNVDVEEKSTGELTLGGGYSTSDGVLGDISIRERNLLGRGQDLRLSATIAQKRQNFNIGFTEPKFLGYDLAAGVDLFDTRSDLTDRSSYVQKQTGIGFRASYPLSERWSQNWGYRLYEDQISDVSSSASRYIREQEGDRLVSQVSQGLTYDTRNSRVEPTEGHLVAWTAEVAGLGGDVNFIRNRVSVSQYFPVADQWTLLLFGEGGEVTGYGGKDVTINNRYFLGGETLRGFELGGIGPRDLTTNDTLGGKYYARGTTELSLPLGLPEDLGIKGYVFSDAGILADPGFTGVGVVDDRELRLSAGAGISWRSPFGPIRVDLAEPILSKSYDDKQLFRFSFGTRF